jgi:hypothetical protein
MRLAGLRRGRVRLVSGAAHFGRLLFRLRLAGLRLRRLRIGGPGFEPAEQQTTGNTGQADEGWS